ncbi:Crp/Fnr family transcriptional regulator [Inquilinus sp. NPDC058860]|uniref:Crp/Fnr family transcriptional regulator n=1 Tax=Inquilinus sp. NPDC058860 TaxID=3346652 RepID=UPI003685C4FB
MMRGLPLESRLNNFISLSEEELRVLRDLHTQRTIHNNTEHSYEDDNNRSIHIILRGWGYTYKDLPNGKRQLIDILIPGDVAGLRTSLFGPQHQGFRAIGELEAAEINGRSIVRLFHDWPRIALALFWIANQDAILIAERLVDIGRRSAVIRVSRFLLELGARLETVGLATRDGFHCPLTQNDIADALGLSAIHVNRVLRQLREQGLLAFRNAVVEFLAPERLIALAQFEAADPPAFTTIDQPPRRTRPTRDPDQV